MKFIKDLGMIPTGRIVKGTTREDRKRKWLMECECGRQTEVWTSSYKCRPSKHCPSCAMSINNTKHGKRDTKLYNVYYGMLGRCYNAKQKDYKHYGARGIQVCDQWKEDFMSFYDWANSNGYAKGLSIDRKDNDKEYSPSNCRWVKQNIQVRNSRKLRSTNTSGYRGVTKKGGKWITRITVDYKRIHIASCDTPEEAGKAYDDYVDLHKLEHTKNKE